MAIAPYPPVTLVGAEITQITQSKHLSQNPPPLLFILSSRVGNAHPTKKNCLSQNPPPLQGARGLSPLSVNMIFFPLQYITFIHQK